MNRIDWTSKLDHLLQTLAFCLAVATIQWGFQPERPYAPSVAYSIAIGTIIWGTIDIGRHLYPSAQETGWPLGAQGFILVLGGIILGYVVGNWIADMLCRAFGWYSGFAPFEDRFTTLRTSMLVTLLAGGAGSFYFYSRNRSAYLLRKMGEARRHADEARLKLLETQLEPHMLFNTLANLRALIAVDPPRAQAMLDHMIAYLRATLTASRGATHTLQAEFERLQDYLELMRIRMGSRLAFTLALPAELAGAQVPTLLLQPLVENSIQHGLEPKVEGGRIDVSAHQEAGILVLQVHDTGTGMEKTVSTGTGFGLSQVRERLATLHGEGAQLQVASTPGEGTCATIHLPLVAAAHA